MSSSGKSLERAEDRKTLRTSTINHLWDAAVFLGFLLFSGLAIAAVAIATPLILAVSALAGLLSNKADGAAWRPAHA